MNIHYAARKTEIEDDLRERAQVKLDKFDRFFGGDADAYVTLTQEKERFTVEITIKSSGLFFRAENTSFDKMESLEKVCTTLSKQIIKNKTKLISKLRVGAFKDIEDFYVPPVDEPSRRLVKTKSFSAKPMTVDEAILQMDLLGHPFFLFNNAETNTVSAVYLRNDGDYGLIEPEF